MAEKMGRIKVIFIGAIWGVIGASLQTSAQNRDWMICGKVMNKPQRSVLG